ncbi:hypothetical protein IKF15_01935 [Candidatus Saccharibacteria bacterium]|nr:hypothetical protein [Candidatus Saccharibacteria bacterium]
MTKNIANMTFRVKTSATKVPPSQANQANQKAFVLAPTRTPSSHYST